MMKAIALRSAPSTWQDGEVGGTAYSQSLIAEWQSCFLTSMNHIVSPFTGCTGALVYYFYYY